VAVDVGELQLRAGMGRSFRTITRIPDSQPPVSSRPTSTAASGKGSLSVHSRNEYRAWDRGIGRSEMKSDQHQSKRASV
jgi:hypothetical protein